MLKLLLFLVAHVVSALHHTNLQSVSLQGNSTYLKYFYAKMYVGTHEHPQYLIVDTGSSVAAMPCKEICE